MKKFTQAIRSEGVPRHIGKLAISTFVLGVLMSAFAIISVFNVRSELREAFAAVSLLRKEQASEREILRRILDAETALRGFALTGEEQYLAPYLETQAKIGPVLQTFRAIRTDPPERYRAFDDAAEGSWREIVAMVEIQRRAWPDTSELKNRLLPLKGQVDALRQAQEVVDQRVATVLEERRSQANDTVANLLAALAILSLGLVLLSFAQLREMALQAARFLRSERKAADEITGLEKAVAVSRSELDWVNRQQSMTLRSAGVQVFTLSRDGIIDWVADEHSRLNELTTIPCALPDIIAPAQRPALLDALERVVNHGEEHDLEIMLVSDERKSRWLRLHLAPQGQHDAFEAMGCAFDISDLKAREENNFWLMRELSHRSKNLLAIVQSIVRQTARHAYDKEAFLARFSARLQALAASHDLLVKTDYAGADLADLIRSQLGGVDQLIGSRIHLAGPALTIRAEAAQNLGMALHELAANAMVHGALQTGSGTVNITWTIEDAATEPVLRLDWVEGGVTIDKPPGARGFGDMLIRVNLPRSLEGEVSLDHNPDGTRCSMRLPLRRLKPDFVAEAG